MRRACCRYIAATSHALTARLPERAGGPRAWKGYMGYVESVARCRRRSEALHGEYLRLVRTEQIESPHRVGELAEVPGAPIRPIRWRYRRTRGICSLHLSRRRSCVTDRPAT